MAPVGIIYQALIQSNCRAFLGNDVDVDIVSQLDSSGTWRVHVLKTERGRRTAVLSEAAPTLQGAFEQLHRVSAKAVDHFVSANGFDLPPEASSRTVTTTGRSSRRGDEKGRSTESLELVSVSSESESESESEPEADMSASESDGLRARNVLGGGRRCRKTHHRRASHRRAAKQDEAAEAAEPAHRPAHRPANRPAAMLHNAVTVSPVSALGAPSTTTAAAAGMPPSLAARHLVGFDPEWRSSWHGPATTTTSSAAPSPPGVLQQGFQPRSTATTAATAATTHNYGSVQGRSSYNHHRQQQQLQQQQQTARSHPQPPPIGLQQQLVQQIRQRQLQLQRQQNLQSNCPPPPHHKLPTRRSVLLCIRWLPHGQTTILDECHLSVCAVLNRTRHILRTQALDLLDGLSPLDVTPAAVDALCVTLKRLRVGDQVYVLGPGFQDDLSAMAVEPMRLLTLEIEVSRTTTTTTQQQQQRQGGAFAVGRGRTGVNGDE